MKKQRPSLNKRYDTFCRDAQDLLDRAGLARPEQTPVILGKALHEACNQLATLHLPEDKEVNGRGPRGLIWSMYKAFDSKKSDLSSSLALAELLKRIIEHRPPLDVEKAQKLPWEAVADMHACPFYENKRTYTHIKRSVFVLMPFGESWSDRLWNDHIQEYLRVAPDGKKLIVRRADDMYGQAVMEDVYEGIVTATLVLAECTGRNANVLYELGIAHALGKRTVLLSQREEDVPFDLQRFRFCVYEDNSSGYPKLRQFLEETMREVFV